MVLDTLAVSWLAMRGEFERATEAALHLQATGEKMGLSQQDDAVAGAQLSIQLWRGEYDGLLAMLRSMRDDEVLPLDSGLLALLVRAGHLEEARALRAEVDIELGGDTWFSLLPWALGAESALALGDRDLAAATYALLAPHAGEMACAGSGSAFGPVDAFLAMAAAATGEADLAARHASDALELCREWRLPLVAEWFDDQRDRYGF